MQSPGTDTPIARRPRGRPRKTLDERDDGNRRVELVNAAARLFRRKGYRKFRVWGWDGCYLDGKDHVRPQVHKGEDRTVIVDDQTFQTTTTWAALGGFTDPFSPIAMIPEPTSALLLLGGLAALELLTRRRCRHAPERPRQRDVSRLACA